MSRGKVAPVLVALLRDLKGQCEGPGDVRIVRMATAEARALLAVARTAENADHDGDCPEFNFDAAPGLCTCPHKLALARLRSLSKKGAPAARPSRKEGRQ